MFGFCESPRVWYSSDEVNASCFLPVLIPPSLIHIAPLGLEPCPVFCVAFPSLPLLRIISGAVAPDLFGKCAQGLFLPVLLQLAFPHSDDSPSHGIERLCRQLVTPDVVLNLRLPELRIGLWPRRIPATAMSMPEAAIHEYACPILRQHHIRTSKK